ncbi:hypothetical protein SBA3_670010 [Candidatus Sulfopaludibacter sp. SbA3]|nr:hypothetical protein SBA3_670010 [Candidatus Sulfopaludibacter sp. SbA3]
MRVPLDRSEWYLCDSTDQPSAEYVEFQGDQALALQWLNRFRGDVVLFAKLRGLFDRSWRYDDSQLLKQIAGRLALGVWRARRPASRPIPRGEAAAEFAERRDPTESTSSSMSEPSLFPDDVDFLAIADARKEAARLGVPFCEECAKAALTGR